MTVTRNRGGDMGWLRNFGSCGAHKNVLAASCFSLEDCVLWCDDIEKQAKAQTTEETSIKIGCACMS